jgi:hypothetical protein
MTRSTIALVILVCATAALAATQAADLSGSWAGVTQVPNVGEDQLKMELKADGAGYSGMVTDSAGMILPNAITNVKVDGATLTFDIAVNDGQATFAVHIALKADGDTLTGSWATDEGESAPITLTRQK